MKLPSSQKLSPVGRSYSVWHYKELILDTVVVAAAGLVLVAICCGVCGLVAQQYGPYPETESGKPGIRYGDQRKFHFKNPIDDAQKKMRYRPSVGFDYSSDAFQNADPKVKDDVLIYDVLRRNGYSHQEAMQAVINSMDQ